MGLTNRLGALLDAAPPCAHLPIFRLLRLTCRILPRSVGSPRLTQLASHLSIPDGMAVRTKCGITLVETSKDILELLLFGEQETENTNFFTSVVPLVDLVIDVGAHLGYYALIASRLLHNKGQVLALEPVPSTFQGLLKNILANDLTNISARNVAVFSQTTELRLDVPVHAPFPGGTMAAGFYKGGMTNITVPAVALDDLLTEEIGTKKTMILIDIEGAEHYALQGMSRTLASVRPLLLLELHPAILASMAIDCRDTMEILRQIDYRCLMLGQGGKKLLEFDLANFKNAGSIPRWIVGMPGEDRGWAGILAHAGIEFPAKSCPDV